MYANTAIFPGVYFETVKPELETVLPRMDIAAFVGFASSGPLHTPVAVEDIARFREIFGADLELAWNDQTRQTEKSCLGSAVEGFFRNGGKRCWVVRVADENLAQTARFAIPGLYRCDGNTLEQAYASARSAGSWAEYVRLRSQLNTLSLRPQTDVLNEIGLQIRSDGWFAKLLTSAGFIAAGDLLSVTVDTHAGTWFLVVDAVVATSGGARVSGTRGFFCYSNIEVVSPPVFAPDLAIPGSFDGLQLFNLQNLATLGAELEWSTMSSPDNALPQIHLLDFQLRSLERNGQVKTLDALRFTAGHPRFWGTLPADETLFAQTEGQPQKKIPPETVKLLTEANVPRFPVCAAIDSANCGTDFIYLPLLMDHCNGISSRAEFINSGGVANTEDKLSRDGLRNFGSLHFLDTRLTDLSEENLLQEANRLVYLTQPPAKLRGLHGILMLKEATLIALPDAMHARWDDIPPELVTPMEAPELNSVQRSEEYEDHWLISWSAVAEARHYRLEWSRDPDFRERASIVIGSDDLPQIGEAVDLLPEPLTEYLLLIQSECPREYYVRVRAERETDISPWSNQRAVFIPEVDFTACGAVQAHTLEVELNISANSPAEPGVYVLNWVLLDGLQNESDIDTFELQRADEFGFFSPVIVFHGEPDALNNANFPSFEVQAEAGASCYFRVRATKANTTGPWSNTAILWPSQLDRVTLRNDKGLSADCLAVHRATLRACAARGDLFAVLGFPRSYEVQDVLDHCAVLNPGGGSPGEVESINTAVVNSTGADDFSARVRPLSIAEQKAATHAALYHPWISARIESSLDIRTIPPEGCVLGKFAHRALEQGAWIAPANSPFENVLALHKPVSREQWLQLMQARVNVLRRESRGHLLMSADTFSGDREWNEINVRRLMSLIRRIAEREGNLYVFENNNDLLHDKVKQQFDNIFARLFARGAFAGSKPDQAYKVITGTKVNTVQSAEAGRFIVELHVAPSHPMKFIRVRLVQEGSGQFSVQEIAS
jgi:Phage tail sheath protein FI